MAWDAMGLTQAISETPVENAAGTFLFSLNYKDHGLPSRLGVSRFGYSCGYRGCDGVVGSPLRLDKCGVCGGNNSCASGCDGKPNSTLTYDICGECGGNGKSCMG